MGPEPDRRGGKHNIITLSTNDIRVGGAEEWHGGINGGREEGKGVCEDMSTVDVQLERE